jgi:hypothetical protein
MMLQRDPTESSSVKKRKKNRGKKAFEGKNYLRSGRNLIHLRRKREGKKKTTPSSS